MSFNFSDLEVSGQRTPMRKENYHRPSPVKEVPLTPAPPVSPPPPEYDVLQTSFTYISSTYSYLRQYSPTLTPAFSWAEKTSLSGVVAAKTLLPKSVASKVSEYETFDVALKEADSSLNPIITSVASQVKSGYAGAKETLVVLEKAKPVLDVVRKVLPVETAAKVTQWVVKVVLEYKAGSRIEA
mmetsp:Transcript_26251/g.52342  ORF Transcript_26251/g.52342 Transcript_26251/m.52342 type:complete len:184 (-) Transcript_26251:151-702(-)